MPLRWCSHFILISLIVLAGGARGDVMLKIRLNVTGEAPQKINLLQLVESQRLDPALEALLRESNLGEPPVPGETQILDAQDLAESFRSTLRGYSGAEKIRFQIPRAVRVTTRNGPIPSSEGITAELLAAWKPLCEECQMSIEALSMPRVQGTLSLRIKPKAELPHGSFSIPVDVVRAEGPAVSAWINGKLMIKRKVPVATRQLARPARLNPEDIIWEWRDISAAYDGVPKADEITIKHLKRDLRAGEILFSGALEADRAVRRGEVVQACAGDSGIDVSANAIADQDGVVGEWIHLKTVKGGIGLEGQVSAAGEVRLK